jgi:sarcosine oxidase subunit beta
MESYDVIVVGAGIVGLSTGYYLQKAGAKVLVLDKGATAYESSSRATGYLSLRGETPEECPLAQVAEELWSTLDDELGYPTEWTPKGRLWAALNETDMKELEELMVSFSKTNIEFKLIDGNACREIVPSLSEKALGGIHTTRSGHANPQRTSQAFAWAFSDLGGVIKEYTPVYSVIEKSGRVVGVRTTDTEYHADRVVLCAAAQNAILMNQFGVTFPVAPVRLEAMITTPLPPLFDVCFIGNGISIRQTKRGNLHVNGGPHEWIDVEIDQESEKPNTPIVRHIAHRLLEAMPIAKNAQLLRCWAGIVDVTPDQMTLIHRFETPAGLVAASAAGHGFGMAPALGKALSELTLNGGTNLPISFLTLDRFKKISPDWRQRKNWHAGSFNT